MPSQTTLDNIQQVDQEQPSLPQPSQGNEVVDSADTDTEEESPEEQVDRGNMAPIKIPNMPASLRFDRNDPKAYKTFAAFRKNMELFISLGTAADDATNWTEPITKRLVTLALGEVEQLMCASLITEVSLNATENTHKCSTLARFLDELGKVFVPTSTSKLAQEAFQRAKQGPTETVDVFYTRLRSLFSQAHQGKEIERQDVLVQKFTEGLRNTMAKYQINAREDPVGDDIELAVRIANASVGAQIAEAPRTRRDAIAQGLAPSNMQANEALSLINQLEPAGAAAPYSSIMQGAAAQDLNQTIKHAPVQTHQLDPVEDMEIGALAGEDEIDPEIFEDPDSNCLLEGIIMESQAYINAINTGRSPNNLTCYYCNDSEHFIRNCNKRATDLKNGIYRGAGRGRAGWRGTRRGTTTRFQGNNYRGTPSGRSNWNNTRGFPNRRGGQQQRGQYSAGMVEEIQVADEGPGTMEETTRAIAAMQLQQPELEREIDNAFDKGGQWLGAIHQDF